MKIPLLDLKSQYKTIKDDVLKVVEEIFESQYFILGPRVEALEKEIAGYCRTRHAVGVSSGTDALLISLMAADIGHHDKVITTPYTFFATVGSIVRAGARPVFVDIDQDTYNISPECIDMVIADMSEEERACLKAIMPVHLYGQCADMQNILKIAEKYKLIVIEDAAQAIGAEHNGMRAGAMGDFGCFSFFPSKNLGAFGDGGIITTNSEKIYKKLLGLRDYGRTGKYVHAEIGFNSRLDTVQAAVLIEKLKYLDSWNRSRMEKAKIYDRLLNEVKGVVIPKRVNFGTHVYHVYAIRLKNRNIVQKRLCENGVSAIIHYPIPLHLQKAYKHLGYKRGDFPVAEKVAREIVSLPLFPHMKNNQINFVVDKLKELLSGK